MLHIQQIRKEKMFRTTFTKYLTHTHYFTLIFVHITLFSLIYLLTLLIHCSFIYLFINSINSLIIHLFMFGSFIY